MPKSKLDLLLQSCSTSAASMTSCRVIWLLLIMMPVMASGHFLSAPLSLSLPANGTRWELLEAAANRIHVESGLMTSIPPEQHRYYLWNLYKSLSRSQRLEIFNEMSETLKKIAYRDSRVDMIGLILFGPEKDRSVYRLRYDMLSEPVDALDFMHCSETVDGIFVKHCGPRSYMGLRQSRSLSNLCYLATKAAIEDAIIHSCGFNIIEHVPEEQVPPAFGSGLPLSAGSDILNQDVDDKGVAHWAMHILAVTAIYLSYVGSPSAIVATAFCLALKYVISSIIAPKIEELACKYFTNGWTSEEVAMAGNDEGPL